LAWRALHFYHLQHWRHPSLAVPQWREKLVVVIAQLTSNMTQHCHPWTIWRRSYVRHIYRCGLD